MLPCFPASLPARSASPGHPQATGHGRESNRKQPIATVAPLGKFSRIQPTTQAKIHRAPPRTPSKFHQSPPTPPVKTVQPYPSPISEAGRAGFVDSQGVTLSPSTQDRKPGSAWRGYWFRQVPGWLTARLNRP